MAVKRITDYLGLEYVKRFTQAYREGGSADKYRREILCEDVQFPTVLVSPKPADLLCGKRLYPEIGYSPQYGGLGYYFTPPGLDEQENPGSYSESEQKEWRKLKDFWENESTYSRCRDSFSPMVRERLPETFDENPIVAPAYVLYRMGGLQLDYQKLVGLGISGLQQSIENRVQSGTDDEGQQFLKASAASVERVERCIHHLIGEAGEPPVSDSGKRLVSALNGLLHHAPETFHEALQLALLVQVMSGTLNFGRLDTVLGPYLESDLNTGRLIWADALDLMKNFYEIIEEEILHFDGRIIVGGKGRNNEASADLFAILAMETVDSLSLPMPQLSLRFYEGQDSRLLGKGLDVIGHGKTFPMLYNDEVNISAVMNAFQVDRETAEQYVPFGCGEYIINSQSCGTPNFIINLSLCLNLAMNHGCTISGGREWAPDYGGICEYRTLEELWQAYNSTVRFFLEAGAPGQETIYRITGEHCPFSLISLLYDDCISRARPIFGGGIRYLGGTNETYGNTNTADALTSIDELVFKSQRYSGKVLLEALKSDWVGYEEMHRDFLLSPKYGNDDMTADGMVQRVHNHICQVTSTSASDTGLHHFLVVVINNNTNTLWGLSTPATPDGRKSGAPLAPGNSAAAGADRSGLTALLNSQTRADPSIHAGAVQNLRISSDFADREPELFRALLDGYWIQGGTQLMITVNNRADLLAALDYPEQYPHILVRVGGFSARFIDLDPDTQKEILSRTEHGGGNN